LGLVKYAPVIALLKEKSPVDQLRWINEHGSSLKSAPGLPGTPGSESRPGLSADDKRKLAVGVNDLL
jgi:hypothetical protein